MSRSVRSTLAILLATFLAATAARAAFLPLDDPAYQEIDALMVRGYQVVPVETTKPYSLADIAAGLSHIRKEKRLSPYERRVVDRLWKRFHRELLHPAKGDDWWFYMDANPRVIAQHNAPYVDRPREDRLPARRYDPVTIVLPDTTVIASEPVPMDALRMINTLDVTFRVIPGLTTFQRLQMDTDGLANNNHRGKQRYFRLHSTGEVLQAYALYEMRWGKVAFGRIPIAWGPGREGNLLISENAPAIDMLMLQANVHWLHFTSFTGELLPVQWSNGVYGTNGTYWPPGQVAHRYIVGHRLVLTPAHWIEMGFAETLIHGGPTDGFSLKWSNPLIGLTAEEVNIENVDDNAFASADVTLRPVRDVETYGSLLIDDIALDGKSPNRIGWTLGARWEAPFGWDPVGLGLEYTRISRWVYNAANYRPDLRYTNDRAVLGDYLGPDGDALYLTASWAAPSGYRVTALGTYRRLGSTRFNSTFPVNSPGQNFGYNHEPFPYPIVETTSAGEIQLATPEWWGLTSTGSVILRSVVNFGNQPVGRSTELGFRLDLDWHLRYRH